MLSNLPSSIQALTLLALLLAPVIALPAPQTDKNCSPDPCANLVYPMTPYCWQGGLYCTVSGYITVPMGACDLWCPSGTENGTPGIPRE
ncbi:hypothetical protein V8F06_012574 [Rhypophila decipiens]